MKLICGKTLRKNSAWTPVFILAASLLMGATYVQAATTFTTTTNATGNWNAAASWAGGVAPSGAGNLAVQGAASVTRTLNVATTIGQVKNTQGSARLFTIAASGTIAMTMDNTGGTTNVAGDSNSFIGSTSSGGMTFTPNLIIQNTDLDIYQNGSTQPSGNYGTLGSSTITATSARNLIFLQNFTGGKVITINHSIGSSGSVITVQNKGAGNANPGVILAGVVGPNAAVVQNSATSSLELSAANTYTGGTTISAGTLILSASGSLAAGSTVSIAAGATFDVSAQAAYTLGTSATLSASGNASAATIKGGTTVNLGSRPVSLTYDGSHAALILSTGTLQLNNNTFTVVVPGAALTAGTYTLVSTPGAITGTPNATPSFTGGNGIASGDTGTISVSGNNVILTVTAGGGSGPITLVNSSFETNTSGTVFANKVTTGYDVSGTNNVAGWLNAGSTYADSGVDFAGDHSITAQSGTVVAYCKAGDSGAYQISAHQMQSGEQLTLTWWAKSSAGSAAQTVSLLSGASTSSTFSSLTTLATSTAALNNTGNGGAYTQYTLNYTATAADAGRFVAVSLLATGPAASKWAMFDSFALSFVAGGGPGPVSAPNSTVSPALASLTANGGSTQVITVQARDASNNNITTGGATIVFARSGTGTISSTTDNGNGTYTATLTAPTSAGSGTITASLNGTSVGTLVGASQCAATYFSTNFGDAIFGLTGSQTTNFTVGDAAFGKVETVASGLGPIFNNSGCANCHNFPVDAGSGSATVTRFGSNSGGVFNPLTSLGGSLLQDNSTTTNFEVVPGSANVTAKRETTPTFGSGLIEAIADSTIESNALVANADHIVGTVALVTDLVDGKQHVGRFGWKAQLATLLSFTADAANNEMGITSRIEPVGQAPNGNTNLYNQLNTVADPNDVIDSSGKADIDRMSDYMRLLSPPPTLPLTANAVAGKTLFSSIGCAICHTPSMPSQPNFIPVSDLASETNTPIAAISSKQVNLYSDLLLHNMGSLADGIAQAAASTNQMRTAPLWGLRESLPYLHDGRALTVDAAIRAHAGDALPAATRYINLSTNQQQQVVQFLNSL